MAADRSQPAAPRPAGDYRQSAAIPWRLRDGRVELLLITSRRRKRWIVPKGIVEPHLSPAESAANEALEEAGVTGRISARPVGRYEYRKWGGVCSVEVYTLRVESILDRWPEEYRKRRWLTPEEASRRVEESELKNLLQATARELAKP